MTSLNKFYKNFILCGEVDHHCLLCDETFHKVDDIEKHIRWEKHRKAIKTQTCLSKFKNDGIFKIEAQGIGYFCQHCNKTFKNIATVKDHVGTESHISNKTTPNEDPKQIEIKYELGTIYIKNIKVESHQWHSVLNKKCFLCNIDVDNVVKHIQTLEHIINLIQTETKYEGDKCYRKINDDIFQCFTCKKTFPATNFDSHWLNSGHAKTPSQSPQTNGHNNGPIKIYNSAEYTKFTEREFSIEKLANIKDDKSYKVDLENKKIICRKCNNAVKNTGKHLVNHLFNKHKTYSTRDSTIIKYVLDEIDKEVIFINEEDHGKARHDLAVYGRDNHIKLNCGGSKGYCTLCDRFLSAHINIFKQHVNGKVHNGHLEINNELKPRKHKKGPSRTETLSRYLYKIDWIPELSGVAVNKLLCIDRDSFLLMKEIEHGPHFKKTKCFTCDEILPHGSEKVHSESKIHKSNLLTAKVVLEKLNFIREIRPKLYHCGLCNITLPFWETLEKHVTDMSHKMKICEKHFVHAMGEYEKYNGVLPSVVKIEHSTNNDILYANILLGVYGDN